MGDVIYPSNAELNEIAQVKLPRLEQGRPIFQIFPIVDSDSSLVMWEQKDNYKGLQQLRGLNGQPARVNPVGASQYQMRPGVYGEYYDIDEVQLTERRQYGTFNQPISINDLVMEGQDLLLQRRLDRIEYIGWTLLTTGTFSVALPNGAVAHTDTYTTQTLNASTWGTHTTATPLADLRAARLKGRGTSSSFGVGAVAYANQATIDDALANTNSADLGGKRMTGLAQPLSLSDVNQLLTGEGLPNLQAYDEGYIDDTGTFQLFIPAGVVVVIGRRPGNAPIGKYVMTRNANNPGLGPGAYMKVIDNAGQEVPRQIQVHDGHNGGPALEFPGAVLIMDVS